MYSVACEVVERTGNTSGCICGGDVLEKLNAVPSEKLHSECDLNVCDFKLVENFLATNSRNLGILTRIRRSSPRTAKRPRTGLDRTDLGPVLGPGPASVLNGPVLVLNFSRKV